MMRQPRRRFGPPLLAGLGLAALAATAPLCAETPVALELVLAIDASSSIDPFEHVLQRVGLSAAFRDPGVVQAVESVGAAGIAVTVLEFAGAAEQSVLVEWVRVAGEADAAALATALEGAPERVFGGGTAIGAALATATGLIDGNGYHGSRRVIDVCGDGVSNRGLPVTAARSAAIAGGITINGLAITRDDAGLEDHYRTQVIGGPGAFLMVVDRYQDFAQALRRKLIREIEGLPLAGRTQGVDGPG
jgi:hypothetical protein